MGVVVTVLLALLFSSLTIERGELVAVASEVEISQLLLLPLIKIDNIIVVADNKYRNKRLFPCRNNID